jgi:arylsulfatase A-like enzyme
MLDDLVGTLVTQLRATPDGAGGSLYDNALIVFSSDNGSPLDMSEAGGNNYPLRGGECRACAQRR